MRTIIIPVALLVASAAPAATHQYTITLADDLKLIQVEARFAPGVTRISARAEDAQDNLTEMRDCREASAAFPIQ